MEIRKSKEARQLARNREVRQAIHQVLEDRREPQRTVKVDGKRVVVRRVSTED